ncbi:aspartic peptidase domain-containing protein [Leucosporidium creatinivorum]|uniref:Aspartic peptidase domain-containing protein n=1 Tax=Leucosporidium creatinivorum TaxID=106004 RepID=A0A1Y2ELK2_9BASI|nr:aspartic peptidase domain-containing protein [Leucosporidium creatinivorum]
MLAIALLPLLLVPSALASPVTSETRAITLSGSPVKELFADGHFNEEIAKRECSYTQEKYLRRAEHEKAVSGRKHRKAKRGVATVDLLNYGAVDQAYVGGLSIGTPAQTLPVVFDTGSADLWLATQCFDSCPVGYFHANESTTYVDWKRSSTSTYPTGSIHGKIGTDTVTVGGISVAKQFFTAVSSIDIGFKDAPFAGVMGLAFQAMASYNKPTFLDNLMSANKLTQNIFGVYLNQGLQLGSSLTLGAIDATKYTGALTEFAVETQTYWDIRASGYYVGDKVVYRGGIRAAMDTGASATYLPINITNAIYAAIPDSQLGYFDPASGAQYYNFPCASTASVGFTFRGSTKKFHQTAAALISAASPVGVNRCVGSVVGVDINDSTGMPISVIGVPFLKSWYSVYNLEGASGTPTVSLAAAV